MHDSHDKHHEHHHEGHEHHHEHHCGDHVAPRNTGEVTETEKLRKMVEHWIAHNEDHARSYRLWASRAKDAGHIEPGAILEDIASDIIGQNEKLIRITQIIDSSK